MNEKIELSPDDCYVLGIVRRERHRLFGILEKEVKSTSMNINISRELSQTVHTLYKIELEALGIN